MKRLSVLLLLCCLSTLALGQTENIGVRRNANWNGTVYVTSQKIALPDVARRNKSVQIVNYGKLGGGSGYLYVGFITKFTNGTVNYDTTYAATGWTRVVKIPPPTVLGDFVTKFILDCRADSLYMKSSDSVSVSIIVE